MKVIEERLQKKQEIILEQVQWNESFKVSLSILCSLSFLIESVGFSQVWIAFPTFLVYLVMVMTPRARYAIIFSLALNLQSLDSLILLIT
jgi:hypothetical protein